MQYKELPKHESALKKLNSQKVASRKQINIHLHVVRAGINLSVQHSYRFSPVFHPTQAFPL